MTKFKPFASIKETAEQLGIDPDTIYDIIRADEQTPIWKRLVFGIPKWDGLPINPERIGKRWYFRWSDIRDFINGDNKQDELPF